ncbi:MAG: hypothetical protein AB1515_06380 [Nitrospirota bacterium]
MLAEQQIGQEHLLFWWSYFGEGRAEFKAHQTSLGIAESVLNEKLRAAGFAPVDVAAKSGQVTLEKAYGIVDLTDQSAQAVGRTFGADIVILGKALSRRAGDVAGSSMQNAHANLSARAVRVATGEVVASGTSFAPGLHIDETTAGALALRAAAEQLADRLIEQMQRAVPPR